MVYPPSNHKPVPAERFYCLLLRAYPRDFCEEYESEMLLLFRDAYRETAREQGIPGILRLWRDFSYDFVKTVCIEHVKSWMQQGTHALAPLRKDQCIMTLPFALHIAQHTDIGRQRKNNEDNLLTIVPQNNQLLQNRGALFVVSDGMGGHMRGEVASELAVQKIKEYYYQNIQDTIPTALQTAIKLANASIYQQSLAEQAQETDGPMMGATCVAAVLHDHTLHAANVGDSRIYVLHDGNLRQITRDHSLVAQLLEKGEITPEEARTHEKRNVIYRALGQAEVEVDLFAEPVEEGDTLILCTDGLSNMVENDDLRAIVEQYNPEESVQRLIARANEKGGPDNITAIVVRVSAA